MTFPLFRDNRVIMVHLRFTSLLLGLLLSFVVAPVVPTVLANKGKKLFPLCAFHVRKHGNSNEDDIA